MSRRPRAENRDVLKIKFDALQDYLSHHERKLAQFQLDVEKAFILSHPDEGLTILDRILDAMNGLYMAGPPASLIGAEMAEARALVEYEYQTSPAWAEEKRRLIEVGYDSAEVVAGFGPMLGHAHAQWLRDGQDLRAKAIATGWSEDLAVQLCELVGLASDLMDLNLLPARQLRQRWIDQLNGRAPGVGRKPGRPKDPVIQRRDRKMVEAWATGQYRKYAELARAFGVSEALAQKVVRKEQRRARAQDDEARNRSTAGN